MELIIKEQRRNRAWYFYNGEYISKSLDGNTTYARIKGQFLPCPEEIRFKRKMAQSSLLINKRGLYRTEPDPVTVALWNDWQTRQK